MLLSGSDFLHDVNEVTLVPSAFEEVGQKIYASAPRSRTIRVVELSSSSTTSVRERRKSLKDLSAKDF